MAFSLLTFCTTTKSLRHSASVEEDLSGEFFGPWTLDPVVQRHVLMPWTQNRHSPICSAQNSVTMYWLQFTSSNRDTAATSVTRERRLCECCNETAFKWERNALSSGRTTLWNLATYACRFSIYVPILVSLVLTSVLSMLVTSPMSTGVSALRSFVSEYQREPNAFSNNSMRQIFYR